MNDIENQMAQWRKTVWGAGPCQDSSQENFRLTDEEREAIAWVCGDVADITGPVEATLRGLLERTATVEK